MAFVMIPEELLTVDISAAQFRAIVQIMNNTYSSGKFAGCCCLGYQNLAELCCTTKPAIIKTVRQLSDLGFIEINQREKFNRSNALQLTLENGLKRLRKDMGVSSGDDSYRYQKDTDKGYQKDTDKGYQKDTDKGYQKDTEGYLKDTLGYQKDTPHIDLKFKNQDLKNKNARACAREGYLKDTDNFSGEENKKVPADGAAGLSMPIQESAKEVLAESSQLDLEDLCLWQAFKEAFPKRYPWFQLVRAGKKIGLRGIGKMGDTLLDRVWTEVFGWFELRGVPVEKLKLNTRFTNEIIIKEAA